MPSFPYIGPYAWQPGSPLPHKVTHVRLANHGWHILTFTTRFTALLGPAGHKAMYYCLFSLNFTPSTVPWERDSTLAGPTFPSGQWQHRPDVPLRPPYIAYLYRVRYRSGITSCTIFLQAYVLPSDITESLKSKRVSAMTPIRSIV